MVDILKKPYDSVDLTLLLQSFGDTLGTLYPVAHVYDPNNAEITGSPFSLSLIANDLYVLNNAFQADVDSGTYKIVYIVYTDAGHTARSTSHGERQDTVTVSIQATTGKQFGAAEFIYDDSHIRKLFIDEIKKLEKKIEQLQLDFDAGLKVEIPEIKLPESGFDLSDVLLKLDTLKNVIINKKEPTDYDDSKLITSLVELQKKQRKFSDDILDAIKKNRTAIVKYAFDKKMMSPVLESVANYEVKTLESVDRMKIDLTKTIDLRNKDFTEKFIGEFSKVGDKVILAMDLLNESIREKLKFLLGRVELFMIGRTKNNINITVKKDV